MVIVSGIGLYANLEKNIGPANCILLLLVIAESF